MIKFYVEGSYADSTVGVNVIHTDPYKQCYLQYNQMQKEVSMGISLDIHEKLFSAEKRHFWGKWSAVITIVTLIILSFAVCVTGLLWRFGIVHLSYPGNLVALVFSIIVFIGALAYTSLLHYPIVAVAMLIQYRYGLYSIGGFVDYITVVVIYLITALALVRIVYALLARIVPVACPECNKSVFVSCSVDKVHQMVNESYTCRSCGWSGGGVWFSM
jgi:predicted RNA-binding Zn-ribbon protein involved in translation (DUF1610 family)